MRDASGTDLLSSGIDLGCIKEIHSALICDCHQPFSNLQEDVKVSRKSQMLYKPGKQLGILWWSLRTWKSHRPVLFFSVVLKKERKKEDSTSLKMVRLPLPSDLYWALRDFLQCCGDRINCVGLVMSPLWASDSFSTEGSGGPVWACSFLKFGVLAQGRLFFFFFLKLFILYWSKINQQCCDYFR